MLDLYGGWIARIEALQAARVTGRYTIAATASRVSERPGALELYGALAREIEAMRAQAQRERQVNKRVELNVAIRRVESERDAALTLL